ncbi:tetratricopeptide repeat protein [Aquabacterium sp.]|uniref:tetratricopeptide repeat protein n=1 Tax=Aquabacterium sp. TaxID=1872578 RepID=UPI0025C6BB92|nr:tetratricopeptide repeat protein [Aquabacterium sp.]
MIGFVFACLALWALATVVVSVPLWRNPSGVTEVVMPPRKGLAVGLSVSLLALSALLYAAVGQPQGLLVSPGAHPPETEVQAPAQSSPGGAPPVAAGGGMTQAQIEGMVARLAAKLEKAPQDEQGWRMLARSYETLGRFPDAVAAYEQILKLVPVDADLLMDYAVALGMAEGRTLVGKPEVVIAQALKLSPEHPQALALSGSVAYEKHDYKTAIAQWEKLLTLVPPDADMRASIQANVAKARSLLSSTQPKGSQP